MAKLNDWHCFFGFGSDWMNWSHCGSLYYTVFLAHIAPPIHIGPTCFFDIFLFFYGSFICSRLVLI